MARGRGPAQPVDVHETGPAGAERGPVGILAELRERNAQPVDGFQDRRPGRNFDRAIVDNQSHIGTLARTLSEKRSGQSDEKGPAARRRPTAAREAYSLYV